MRQPKAGKPAGTNNDACICQGKKGNDDERDGDVQQLLQSKRRRLSISIAKGDGEGQEYAADRGVNTGMNHVVPHDDSPNKIGDQIFYFQVTEQQQQRKRSSSQPKT